jgi:hypothetical protein
MLLERIKEAAKETLILIEQLNPEHAGKYSWALIEQTFKQELPMLSVDAIEKFRMHLARTDTVDDTITKRKTYWKRRRLPDNFPTHFAMTVPIIDYLKTCKNMTASKVDIYKAIKDNYTIEWQKIPHRARGVDTKISELEYRLEWACTLLSSTGKAVGRKQDATLPMTYIKLVSSTK